MTQHPMRVLAFLILLVACDRPSGQAGATRDESGGCRVVERSLSLPEGLGEPSGAVWSSTRPGTFWSHNDSGGDPELFQIGGSGGAVGRVRLAGVKMEDWEDIAAGPCPSGRCLFVADIGDNGRKNEPISLLVLPEPTGATRAAQVQRHTAAFPDDRGRDAEAIFALPDGSIYLITKGNKEPVELYRWPTPLSGERAVLQRVRELAPEPEQTGDRVTGASASPNGRYVAVRTYGRLAIYRTAELLAGAEPAVAMDLSPLGEGQGEGVALGDDGSVVLVSESGSKHVPGTASILRCQLP
jgi:hypothetical protein